MDGFIVAATRTAGGRKGGKLKDWHPASMAGRVLDSLVARTGIDAAAIDDVVMGCVSQAGEHANNVARNAILASSLPESVPGTSVDRQCGSSQQAVHFAAQAVMSGTMDLVVAGGVHEHRLVGRLRRAQELSDGGAVIAHNLQQRAHVSPSVATDPA